METANIRFGGRPPGSNLVEEEENVGSGEQTGGDWQNT